MKRQKFSSISPAKAVACGAIAGLASTVLLTILTRIATGMENKKKKVKPPLRQDMPDDLFNTHLVEQWQDRSRSPAAYKAQTSNELTTSKLHPSVVTPGGALAEAQGPGPEGAAERFALKLSSGLFGLDITNRAKLAGQVVHYTYGTFWGIAYGLCHLSLRHPPKLLGPAFGFCLWLLGPGFLGPRMKIMRTPTMEPPGRTAIMIAGHIIFGTSLALLCERQKTG